jgi:hypothetical protein
MLDQLLKIAFLGAAIIQLIAAAGGWMASGIRCGRSGGRAGRSSAARAPAARAAAAASRKPQAEWHAERWSDGVVHAVPDNAQVVRRRVVRD